MAAKQSRARPALARATGERMMRGGGEAGAVLTSARPLLRKGSMKSLALLLASVCLLSIPCFGQETRPLNYSQIVLMLRGGFAAREVIAEIKARGYQSASCSEDIRELLAFREGAAIAAAIPRQSVPSVKNQPDELDRQLAWIEAEEMRRAKSFAPKP